MFFTPQLRLEIQYICAILAPTVISDIIPIVCLLKQMLSGRESQGQEEEEKGEGLHFSQNQH